MVAFRVRPAIILYGDSLTQFSFGEYGGGWASLLSAAYQRRADVFNRGFSGYNTRHALDMVPKVFAPAEGGIVFATVFWGANDASLPGERQHVPVEEYGENLSKMILSIRERTAASKGEAHENADFPIFVLTPPPVDNEAWFQTSKEWRETDIFDRTNDHTQKYVEEAKKVAEKHNHCVVLDTWEILGGSSDAAEYGKHLSDGLHLSESGNRLIFDALIGKIRSDFPHLAPMVDGDEKYGETGIPVEEKLWDELC
jgi:lysophospholipase L1-like esterase